MSLDNKTDEGMVAELMALKKANGYVEEKKPDWDGEVRKLADVWLEPPFSVLDTRQGRWLKGRKRYDALGIKSELGRDEGLTFGSGLGITNKSGEENMTSIFDPYLCEVMYKWFCDDGGKILDPFAGGSVRGIVAHELGYKYTGIELRPKQVESNIEQAKSILQLDNQPTWICGDSDQVLDTIPVAFGKEYDMIFSCPPYFDLEIYSQDENDLSYMTYENMLEKYKSIIQKSLLRLKNGGYAVFVVGDMRDERGHYRDFIGDTKRAFMDNYFKNDGAKLYNDIILLNSVGSASMRTKQFDISRKVVKTHQNILCFKKL